GEQQRQVLALEEGGVEDHGGVVEGLGGPHGAGVGLGGLLRGQAAALLGGDVAHGSALSASSTCSCWDTGVYQAGRRPARGLDLPAAPVAGGPLGKKSGKIRAGAIPRGGCRRGRDGEGKRRQAATIPQPYRRDGPVRRLRLAWRIMPWT